MYAWKKHWNTFVLIILNVLMKKYTLNNVNFLVDDKCNQPSYIILLVLG